MKDVSQPVRDSVRAELQEMITVTEVKTRYRLDDDDLDDIPVIVKRNPFYRNAAPMRLYSHVLVRRMSREKVAARARAQELRALSKPRRDAVQRVWRALKAEIPAFAHPWWTAW